MKSLSGLVIQSGIAYGKVHMMIPSETILSSFDLFINQKDLLNQALKTSTEALENAIKRSSEIFNETVAMIFEAHKLMVNDPILLAEAYKLIDEGQNAYEAYRIASDGIITQFKQLTNDYMRNRIIDIQDATDRVLYAIKDTAYEQKLLFDEPRILILEEMKPSIILSCDKKNISGFIVQNGSYDQHASLIARNKSIPGIILENAMNLLSGADTVLMDAQKGKVYINPSHEILERYSIKGAETDELQSIL
jgi:phosphoenolpyruvate-protein phosphotransferase (PTS system enzyme I)